MSARSGLAEQKTSRPHLGPSQAIFSMERKHQKNIYKMPIFLGGPMVPIHPIWALAAIHPRWGNRCFLRNDHEVYMKESFACLLWVRLDLGDAPSDQIRRKEPLLRLNSHVIRFRSCPLIETDTWKLSLTKHMACH